MKVFVTGASGHIGQLATAELITAGHDVVGMARSDAGAERVSALGATPLRATLAEPARVAEAAAGADAVVHLAFSHDFENFAKNADDERTVLAAIADALEGSGKPLLAASGTAFIAVEPGGPAVTEEQRADPALSHNPRVPMENWLLELPARGIRATPVRFSPTVHGPTDLHGFIPALIGLAREVGFSGYVGDGANLWPAVHNVDAARLIALGLEKAPGGTPLHAVAEEGIAYRDIAEAIGRGAGVPTKRLTREEAAALGFFGTFMAVNNPASSSWTREVTGWVPRENGLLEDLAEGFYFSR
ncbi:SDR family oxidoreductase [Gryllotalpicola protaetiae]|uniref:SDR family oxidoreductase n=1 Tax=Gryllotalpicola protaetiae TaxID=2419771 RepID=A0A387BKL4_9MICO|nr:SDR family oxidoreductase [Gryllotalpicola protaetiae]AYG03198.1 SDR family oxidoreductase [Gryllotalpicola protaetiae]